MKAYSINYYRKVDGFGWMFETFKANESNVRTHLRSLIRQKQSGNVREIEAIKLK